MCFDVPAMSIPPQSDAIPLMGGKLPVSEHRERILKVPNFIAYGVVHPRPAIHVPGAPLGLFVRLEAVASVGGVMNVHDADGCAHWVDFRTACVLQAEIGPLVVPIYIFQQIPNKCG